MKMISSSKMHKAEGALRRLVPFRSQIETIIGNLLSSDAQFSSALVTQRPEVKRLCVVVWGSDDGLCGAYNVNIYKRLIVLLSELREKVGQNTIFDILPVGRKIAAAVAKLKLAKVNIIDAPQGIDSKTDGDNVNNFIGFLQQQFEDGTYDRVDALYMNFITAGRQRPKNLQLLPVLPDTFTTEASAATGRPYLFEPDANSIFNTVLPMYLMAAMQDIFTQNRASEAAARVMAMQSANDNAKTLLEQLQLEYNKLRQQSITNELLDIVGGQVHD
jgi:F-type H+-transporting ATPase subunit gamma